MHQPNEPLSPRCCHRPLLCAPTRTFLFFRWRGRVWNRRIVVLGVCRSTPKLFESILDLLNSRNLEGYFHCSMEQDCGINRCAQLRRVCNKNAAPCFVAPRPREQKPREWVYEQSGEHESHQSYISTRLDKHVFLETCKAHLRHCYSSTDQRVQT